MPPERGVSGPTQANQPGNRLGPNAGVAKIAHPDKSSLATAEMWLVPRLASFRALHPGIAIEVETNHRSVDPARREDTLLEETLYEEALTPVCSPALLAARGRPGGPADLAGWPLLYDLGWDADWSYWFARRRRWREGQNGQISAPDRQDR